MKLLWTWGGVFFGYQNNDRLLIYTGKEIGKFYGEEIYSPKGIYLGELKNDNRLIRNTSKQSKRQPSYSEALPRTAVQPQCDYVGYILYVGYEDFILPEDLN